MDRSISQFNLSNSYLIGASDKEKRYFAKNFGKEAKGGGKGKAKEKEKSSSKGSTKGKAKTASRQVNTNNSTSLL